MAQPGECPCRCRAPKLEQATSCVPSQCNRTELWRDSDSRSSGSVGDSRVQQQRHARAEPLAMRPKKWSVSGRQTARTVNTITEQQAQDTHTHMGSARHTRRTQIRWVLQKSSGQRNLLWVKQQPCATAQSFTVTTARVPFRSHACKRSRGPATSSLSHCAIPAPQTNCIEIGTS